MPVSKRLRYEVLRRDNHTCRYCGGTPPDVALTVDHVIPITLGGTDDPNNLVAACRDCNSGKSASNPDQPLVEDVAADALRWRDAMQKAAELAFEQQAARDDNRRWVDREWTAWGDSERRVYDRPSDWPLTVDQLIAAGLDVTDIFEAIKEAMMRNYVDDRWRYTCGILYRTLERRQKTAQELLATQQTDSAVAYLPVGWPLITGACA